MEEVTFGGELLLIGGWFEDAVGGGVNNFVLGFTDQSLDLGEKFVDGGNGASGDFGNGLGILQNSVEPG